MMPAAMTKKRKRPAKPVKPTKPAAKPKSVAELNREIAALHLEIARLTRMIYDGYYEARVILDKFAREASPLLTTLQNKVDRLVPGPWPLVSNHKPYDDE
jgi:hypothetical protein